MVNELIMKQRLESVLRVLDSEHDKLARQMLLGIIDEIDAQVEQFEQEAEQMFESMKRDLMQT
jgi:hypothetical protein